MSATQDPRLDAELAAAALPPAVGRTELLHNPNNSVTAAVEALELEDGRLVVRKVLSAHRHVAVAHWAAGADPAHWNYWRREAEAYDSGFTSVFADAGLRAPEVIGRVSDPGGTEVLFLEHVEGRGGGRLVVEDLVRVAGSLGVAHASAEVRALVERVPAPWWSVGWTAEYVGSRPGGMRVHQDAPMWEHPVVVEGFGEARHRIRRRYGDLLEELGWWWTVLAALPATICHHDLSANNLVCPGPPTTERVGGDDRDVLVDWGFVGVGPLGVDAASLVWEGVLTNHGDAAAAVLEDKAVSAAYLDALEGADRSEVVESARVGSCASALRFAWMPALMVLNVDWSGPTAYGGREGPELVEVFRRRAVAFDSMLDRLDEARILAESLGLPG
jgi:hypothetical protein